MSERLFYTGAVSLLMFLVFIAEDDVFSWRSLALLTANIILWLALYNN